MNKNVCQVRMNYKKINSVRFGSTMSFINERGDKCFFLSKGMTKGVKELE